MASTKLDVSRFAAKVVESATELRKIGATVEDDEINTVFLDGLSRKFYDIVTVETVADNDFDTMLSNVILHAKRHKLMNYRETSSHGYHHLAQEDKRQQHHVRKPFDSRSRQPQPGRPEKKKFFKKKERPSGQFKRWSANGADFKTNDARSHDARPPRTAQRHGFRSNNNREQKEPFMCMQQEVSTTEPETVEAQIAPNEDIDQRFKSLLLHQLSPIRGNYIDLQKMVNDQAIYIKRLARECGQTREQVNDLIGVLNKERSFRRDIQYNFAKLHTQVAKLKTYASIGQFQLVEFASTHFKDYQIEDPQDGYMLEGLETTDDDLDDSDDIGQNYYTNSLPPEIMDEYYPPIRPIPADFANEVFSKCYGSMKKKSKQTYYPSSSNSSSPTVAASPPKETPEPPRKTRKLSLDASLMMSDTYEHLDVQAEEGEVWLADSGASYHTTFDEKDFDEGTVQKCDITVRIGDNNTVNLTQMGQCSRKTEEGRKVVLTKVLLSPQCPTRILSVGKLTSGGKSVYTQDDSAIQLLQKDSYELILKGTLTPHDTANVILFKEEKPTQLDQIHVDQEELFRKHKEWGHLSFAKTRKIMGLPPPNDVLEDSCNDCWKAELKEPKRNKETTQRASLNLHRIHMDLTGVKANNLKGYRIALVMVDDRSRFTWLYPLQNRSEWIDKVIWWTKMIEKQNPPYKVATFRTDSEPTIVNNTAWMDWLQHKGIVHEVAAPYSQFQNGVAERRIGLITKSTKAMLYASGLPMADWYHAMEYATYLLNRTFSNSFPSPDGYLSPYQVFYQGAPDYVPEGIFGCHVLSKIYVKGKMAPATAECVWLGKREHIKADLVRKIATNKESWSRVNKIQPTVFPYLNNGKNRPCWNENFESGSRPTENDWPEETNENPNRPGRFFDPPMERNSIGLEEGPKEISENNWITETTCVDDPPREKNSSIETQSSRLRVPSLRAVEALSANLHNQVATHKATHTQLEHKDCTRPTHENFSLLPDPPSQRKMYSYPDVDDWIVAEEKELYSIIVKHNGFTYLLRKSDMNVLPSHFIYKYKRSPYGELFSRKARFVAGGHRQEYEVDYFETYSATTQLESVRFMLAVAASRTLMLAKFDIETFFLYGTPDTDIIIEQPSGHEILPEGAPASHKPHDYVVLLNVTLYGTKQAPRLSNESVVEYFASIGLYPMVADPQVFIKGVYPTNFVMVCLFVDDGMCAYNNKEFFEELLSDLRKKYTLKVEYQPKDFLSLEIEYHPRYLKLHQTGYVQQILKDFHMTNCNPTSTPISASQVKVITETPSSLKDAKNVNDFPMLTLCGRLLWLTRLSRFDILFATNFLCRYMAVANKLDKLLPIAKRILRYLAGAQTFGLIYPLSKGTDLIVSSQVDSDFAGDITKRSTLCRFTYIDKCLVNFNTKLQKAVATSTCNAESNGITQAVIDIIFYRTFVDNLKGRTWPKSLSPFATSFPPCNCPLAQELKKQLLKWKPAPPSLLQSDSQTALACLKNNSNSPGTKTETTNRTFVHNAYKAGLVDLQHIEGRRLTPDAQTKAVPPVLFEEHTRNAQPMESFHESLHDHDSFLYAMDSPTGRNIFTDVMTTLPPMQLNLQPEEVKENVTTTQAEVPTSTIHAIAVQASSHASQQLAINQGRQNFYPPMNFATSSTVPVTPATALPIPPTSINFCTNMVNTTTTTVTSSTAGRRTLNCLDNLPQCQAQQVVTPCEIHPLLTMISEDQKMTYAPTNSRRDSRRQGQKRPAISHPGDPFSHLQPPYEQLEAISNNHVDVVKSARDQQGFVHAFEIESRSIATRTEVSQACIIRRLTNHIAVPRQLEGYIPSSALTELHDFDHLFYHGLSPAQIGAYLGTLTITIRWNNGKNSTTYTIHIFESFGLVRIVVLINICHGMYGFRIRECQIKIQSATASFPTILKPDEKFDVAARLTAGDSIIITPNGRGLLAGSENAVTPPLGEDASPAAPPAVEVLPTYQQAIADAQNPMDDDEEEEEKLSIPQQIERAATRLAERKRKLDQLDNEREQELSLRHRVQMFECYKTIAPLIDNFPEQMTYLHSRVLQLSAIAFRLKDYVEDPFDSTPIEFQRQHIAHMAKNLDVCNDELDDIIEKAFKMFISDENTPDD